MKPRYIKRNSTMDVVIGAPMLFMCIGSAYALIFERVRNPEFWWFWLGISSIVLIVITVLRVRNKHILVFSADGVYIRRYKRTIPWTLIRDITLEEEDLTHTHAPGSGLRGIKKYLVIQEWANDGSRSYYERKVNTADTNCTSSELLEVAMEYLFEQKRK
jgi:hypothetical protein